MKLLCIDASDRDNIIKDGLMIPLKEGVVYTLRGTQYHKERIGYLLEEIHNRCIITGHPGKEPSYSPKRFVITSDIDETELAKQREELVTVNN